MGGAVTAACLSFGQRGSPWLRRTRYRVAGNAFVNTALATSRRGRGRCRRRGRPSASPKRAASGASAWARIGSDRAGGYRRVG